MTTPHPTADTRPSEHSRIWHADVYIALTSVAAIAAAALLVSVQSQTAMRPVNWVLFAIFSVLLFVSETLTSSLWLRFGTGGVVTLSWTFAFSLLLLGDPMVGVGIMAASTLTAELTGRTGLRKTIFNTAQVALALAVGGLVLLAFGVNGPITKDGAIPTSWGIGLIASGITVFVLNGVVLGYLLSVLERTSFLRMMRDGFARSMMADGILLALAPIFVITVGYSLVVGPLLVIAAYMVYQTARESARREHLSNHDTLTSLRNRRSFGEEIDRYLLDRLEQDTTGIVLLLDLDGFKAINDRLGHQVGDDLLCAFADRLLSSLPSSAVIARLGGDEFAVLLRDVDVVRSLSSIRMVHEMLTAPLIVDDHPMAVGVSIGVSICPDHGTEAADLMRAADVAMYRAKGRQTGIEVFDEVTGHANNESRSLLAELEHALLDDQLGVMFEPQMHMGGHAVESVEALLSWDHTRFGSTEPEEILRLAAHTELIGPLTDSVIESAVRNVLTVDSDDLTVTVKVSPRSFLDGRFTRRTVSLLDRLGFETWRLELAIDEAALASAPESTHAEIQQIRRSGVRIALEGFGAGRRSLLTIRDVRVDRIKIGVPFVDDLTAEEGPDRVIVRSLVDLAHGLGLDIVGVGIEDQVTWNALARLGCDVGQGSHLGQPMNIRDLNRWLQQQSSSDPLKLAR